MPTSGTNKRIIYFGNECIATGVNSDAPILRMLLGNGYDVAAVVLNDNESRSRKLRHFAVETIAVEHDIPVFKPHKIADITPELVAFNAAIGVLVAFGQLIPQNIIDIFPWGIINVHPSLLPKHRGSTPIESTLLSGDPTTGVCLMLLSATMDAGPLFDLSELKLNGDESKLTLASALLNIGSDRLRQLLPGILNGEIKPVPQKEANATYDKRISKQDGVIDLQKPAVQLEREVRAYIGWPGSRTAIAGKDVVITAAHVANNSLENVDNKATFVADKQLCLQTADGILVVDTLIPAGKTAMPASAFLAGYGRLL
ncbi:methionyl-tRNA formyltransferase [Candidatus Saccharibacteria bacterium]|nr:MAG: methionyl-tRNA formyltransferase [Candidatus Saccharibacteria bacterium]